MPELTVHVPVPRVGAAELMMAVPLPALATVLAPPSIVGPIFNAGVAPESAAVIVVPAVNVKRPVPPETSVEVADTTVTVPFPEAVNPLAGAV